MNPIFEYAARGQSFEKKGDLDQAIDWYQRSLACLPNHFGSDIPLKPASASIPAPCAFEARHAARIYADMGSCLISLKRWEDGVLASRAAHCLDRNHPQARKCLQVGLHGMKGRARAGDGPNPGSPGTGATADLGVQLSVVMVTHCVNELKKFKALSPPSTKLLETTYGSMMEVFGTGIDRCPKFLCYDHNPAGDGRDMLYRQAVEGFSRQHGFDLHVYRRIGLFAVLTDILEYVDTPYVLLAEHDWLFRSGPIRLDAIIGDMNRNSDLHCVRFNKRLNHLDGHDFIMQSVLREHAYPLLHTASHSNNPSIIRTDKLKNEWMPLCARALHRIAGNLGGSAFGLEEILFRHHLRDIRERGFHRVRHKWGTVVLGEVGDPPKIVHLGE